MKELSKGISNSIKIVCALLIVCHHCYQKVFYASLPDDSFVTLLLKLVGYYGVVMFLFLSGYGLFKSYELKGGKYLDSFKTKIWVFLKIYIFFTLIYTVIDLLFRPQDFSFNRLLMSFTYGDTIIDYGWYMQLQLLLYILFYYVITNTRIKHRIMFMWIPVIIYILIGMITRFHNFYWLSSFAFPLGCTYQKYIEKRLLKLKLRYNVGIVLFLSLLGIILFNLIALGTPRLIITGLIVPVVLTMLFCIFNLSGWHWGGIIWKYI